MTVLVDTSVWSVALRRRSPQRYAKRERSAIDSIRHLVEDGEAGLIGPIRQEILSGVREQQQFEQLREVLANFPHLMIEEIDYDHAAECYNLCRRAGVAATSVDMLICAVALRADIPVLTLDADFKRYAAIIGVTLYDIN